MVNQEEPIRLQKILAQAGIGSRRTCELYISEGRISVNGQIVSELGARAHLSDKIEVDGIPILTQNKVVYALNKPLGMLTAMNDERLPNVGDLCRHLPYRLFHVGRLDADSEGLLILTNDGDLAQKISHPKHEISKTYQLEIEGQISAGDKNHLLRGVELEDGSIHLDALKIKATNAQTSLIEVRIHSGRNRILRRMFDSVGHPVRRLIRTSIGHLALGNLRPGEMRPLTFQEIEKIFEK